MMLRANVDALMSTAWLVQLVVQFMSDVIVSSTEGKGGKACTLASPCEVILRNRSRTNAEPARKWVGLRFRTKRSWHSLRRVSATAHGLLVKGR